MLDVEQAKKDYEAFWEKHPEQKNPSDVNTQQKFNFSMSIGWARLRNMQAARKAGYDFTKR